MPKRLIWSTATLHGMAAGGMHDHLDGGFHRYSVDERWFVPHFEKMLYDQAQLAVSYLEAYQITGEERFAEAARAYLFLCSTRFDRLAGRLLFGGRRGQPRSGEPVAFG